MDKINIGFLGGCITNQKGISRKDLFHTVLIEKLKKVNPTIDYQISLATYQHFSCLAMQTEQLILKKKPDFICVFIRPFAIMPLNKLLIKYKKMNQQKSIALHPAIFNRKKNWNEKLVQFYEEVDLEFSGQNKFGLRDLNLMLGFIAGLNHWATNFISVQLLQINLLCQQNQKKLLLISPPKNPESLMDNVVCSHTAKYLKLLAKKNNFKFLDFYALDKNIFQQDLVHLNEFGHQQLAIQLFEILK